MRKFVKSLIFTGAAFAIVISLPKDASTQVCTGSGPLVTNSWSCEYDTFTGYFNCIGPESDNSTGNCGWLSGTCQRAFISNTRSCGTGYFETESECWDAGDSGGINYTTSGCSVVTPTLTPIPGTNTSTPPPTPTSSCSTGIWQDQGCGNGGCSSTQMYQTRTVNPPGCASSTRCQTRASCGGSNTAPTGWFDSASCNSIIGWAFDPDTTSTSINVHLYANGPSGSGGTFMGSFPANVSRPDVNAAYGITGNHGFSISTPASLKDGVSHSLYVYAINAEGGTNPLIGGSPRTVSCFPPTSSPTPTTAASCTVNSVSFNYSSISLAVGSSQTLTFRVTDSPVACTTDASFSSSNSSVGITSVNPDTTEPFNVTVICNSVGSAIVTGRARVSGTAQQSGTVGVNCLAAGTPTLPPGTPIPTNPPNTPTPTFTPTPTAVPVCDPPLPKDPPDYTCGSPGTVTWEWNDVNGANQYRLVIQRLVSGVWSIVNDYGWQGAGNFGAVFNGDGLGTCKTTESRPAGTYRSQIQSRNTNILICTTSPPSFSGGVNLVACPGISITDLEITGTGNTATAIVSITSGTIAKVDFSVDNVSIATLNPLTDTSVVFSTVATSVNIGETDYHATASDADGNTDTKTAKIRVLNPPPWWQTGGGDSVSTSTLSSVVPVGLEFVLDGTGGYPGIPIYQNTNLTSTNTSSRDWRADAPVNLSTSEDYSYTYFKNRIPNGVPGVTGAIDLNSSGTLVGGYHVINYTGGSLTLPATNIGSRRVILFVDNGDLTISGPISLTDGQGFLMAIVNGNILMLPSVGGSATADMEGIYFAGNQFKTGSNPTDDDDVTLKVRGTVVGIGNLIQNGIVLERELPDNTDTPAETFTFAPDLITRFPQFLGKRGIRWMEVAP